MPQFMDPSFTVPGIRGRRDVERAKKKNVPAIEDMQPDAGVTVRRSGL